MAKKYLSKIVKNNVTIHVKDADAQAAIQDIQTEMAKVASVAEGQAAIAELT